MKPKSTIKLTILLVSLLVVFCISIGGTIAYIIATDKPVSTTFKPVLYEANVLNNNGTYTVKTSGNVAAFVRVAIKTNWMKDGMLFTEPSITSNDYIFVYDSTKWTLVGEYFYYNSPLDPGETTSDITVILTGVAPEGCTFQSNMIAEILPADPDYVVYNTWGYLPQGN